MFIIVPLSEAMYFSTCVEITILLSWPSYAL